MRAAPVGYCLVVTLLYVCVVGFWETVGGGVAILLDTTVALYDDVVFLFRVVFFRV